MSYAFDPELAHWVPMINDLPFADLAAARAAEKAMTANLPMYEPARPVDVRDTLVPGPEGAPQVPVRIYTPVGAEAADTGLPGLVYMHGGGYVLGSLDFCHSDLLRIADQVGAVVVSVDYRLAPENPFPAGLEDSYATLVWTAGHATELGIDPARLGVGGDSAGGGLATAVALLARDRSGPALCFQYLGVPMLDDRLETPSMRAFTDTPVWNRPIAEICWSHYLGGEGRRGGPDLPAYAAPARAADLTGLPPAFVYVCEFDPLRDEGMIYAQRLVQAGVTTGLHLYPGTFHGSVGLRDAAISQEMLSDVMDGLRRGLRVRSVR
ncbi:acetyl esterase [Streptomyces achromogenes]|uniref:alpha/beta hydrolase n=1 Tax=Streptomyces achromogenes TaxID=67255 RepID=UPI00277D992D|nr:alpha/beta hydrolase [Streptomyces achromogenes]MDQ0834576.1 acetyl esterase [Streptomyces achromogenes]